MRRMFPLPVRRQSSSSSLRTGPSGRFSDPAQVRAPPLRGGTAGTTGSSHPGTTTCIFARGTASSRNTPRSSHGFLKGKGMTLFAWLPKRRRPEGVRRGGREAPCRPESLPMIWKTVPSGAQAAAFRARRPTAPTRSSRRSNPSGRILPLRRRPRKKRRISVSHGPEAVILNRYPGGARPLPGTTGRAVNSNDSAPPN